MIFEIQNDNHQDSLLQPYKIMPKDKINDNFIFFKNDFTKWNI
jgi:hypothetical protein